MSNPNLFSRNWGFISDDLQKKIAATKVLVAGTGLGSTFATLAARTGFTKFILADGDVVEESNCNRQAFNQTHIGKNKAEATKDIIKKINPAIEVDVITQYLTPENIFKPITDADMVINTIDLDSPAFLNCSDIAQRQNKPMFFPMNLGWGGAVYIFTQQSISLRETFQITNNNMQEAKRKAVEHALGQNPHEYLLPILDEFRNQTPDSWPYDPQLAVATSIASSFMVTAIVKLLAGKNILTAPDVNYVDFHHLLSV